MADNRRITQKEINQQKEAMEKVAEFLSLQNRPYYAYIETYGCQQNESDSETIRGMALFMGYELTDRADNADLIVVNTCAVRAHAEQRVLGNVGAMSHIRKRKPDLIIVLTGCMATRPEIQQRVKKSYPYVRVVINTYNLFRLPADVYEALTTGRRVFDVEDTENILFEGLPRQRDGALRAWLPIMYGCNNFCSYCIVPYVRGRERSRAPQDILHEARELAGQGYKEITLLGQNVNSYSRGTDFGMDFADLLREINDVEGDFGLRFMTSHPKDAGEKLIDTMACCDKVCKALHLPFQSGSDRILAAMNRGYTAEKYMRIIEYAKKQMPDIVLTSDVIVGFPGETEKDFEKTLELVRAVRFEALFMFIYSPREGTRAALLPQTHSKEEIQQRFDRLVKLQNEISCELHRAQHGKILRVLIDGVHRGGDGRLTGRTDGNRLVLITGDESCVGSRRDVRITGSTMSALIGEFV